MVGTEFLMLRLDGVTSSSLHRRSNLRCFFCGVLVCSQVSPAGEMLRHTLFHKMSVAGAEEGDGCSIEDDGLGVVSTTLLVLSAIGTYSTLATWSNAFNGVFYK